MSHRVTSSLGRDLAQLVAPNLDLAQAGQYVTREIKADTLAGNRKERSDVQASIAGSDSCLTGIVLAVDIRYYQTHPDCSSQGPG